MTVYLLAGLHLSDLRLQPHRDPARAGGQDQAGPGGGGRGDQRGGGAATQPPVFPPVRSVPPVPPVSLMQLIYNSINQSKLNVSGGGRCQFPSSFCFQ